MENVGMSKIPVLSLFLLLMLASPAHAQDLGTVVLDPGHGGYEFGLQAGKQREKDIALSIAKKLKSFLREEGKEASLTREIDRYLSLTDRRERIDSKSPDIFVSLHLSDSENAVIYVTWYKQAEAKLSLDQYYRLESRQRRYTYESRLLANTLGEALGSEFGFNVHESELPLPLLSATGAPAVLIELPSEGIDYDENTMQRFAYALGIGLQIYERR
jgi:N-acetylmuramoyl-L-alanine amidase